MVTNERRIEMEEQIVQVTAVLMLNAGYRVLVDNGGEDGEHETIALASEIRDRTRQTDQDRLIVVDGCGIQRGWVLMVYGNSGYDTRADYTTNLEPLLAAVTELEDRFEKECA